MKKLILLIALTVVVLPQLSFAEDEVIWETEKIGGLNEVEVSPLGKLLYNTKDSIIQVRNIDDGKLVEEIIFPNTTRLDHISITADGRYMAISGQTKYVIIYDLQERREVKRLTTIANERVEYGENVVYMTTQWLSSSISPDGTKITGIAAWGGEMENFVVIDIETEKVLFEQRRMGYDVFNPSAQSMHWKSAEYSPDGKYIVSQLEFRSGSDSVYIYDAKSFELYDVVLYSRNNNYPILEFSHYSSKFVVLSVNHILIYDIESKKTIENSLNANSFALVFSRNSNHLVNGFDFENHIYDIESKKIIYEYTFLTVPKEISLDNSKMFGFRDNKIYAMKTFFTKSTVVSDPFEIIISPNPTNGLVNISLDCQSPGMSYQINNTSGQNLESKVIDSNNNSLIINFNSYPVGIYYLTLKCNRLPKTYKIIKGN